MFIWSVNFPLTSLEAVRGIVFVESAPAPSLVRSDIVGLLGAVEVVLPTLLRIRQNLNRIVDEFSLLKYN